MTTLNFCSYVYSVYLLVISITLFTHFFIDLWFIGQNCKSLQNIFVLRSQNCDCDTGHWLLVRKLNITNLIRVLTIIQLFKDILHFIFFLFFIYNIYVVGPKCLKIEYMISHKLLYNIS